MTPYIAHTMADVRLDAMEEASRRAIAAGDPAFRIVKPPAPPKTSPIATIPASGLLLGPDGKPIGV